MRRFQFRLQAVLKHRETLQELYEQDFAAAQARLQTAQMRQDALMEHYHETVAARPVSEPGERFDAAAIQSRERYIEAVQTQIEAQAARIEVARLIVDEKRVLLITARQAREAVSRLRDKEYSSYLAESQKQTQNALDELATTRYLRSRNEGSEQQRRAQLCAAPQASPEIAIDDQAFGRKTA